MYVLGTPGTQANSHPPQNYLSTKIKPRYLECIKWTDRDGKLNRFYLKDKIANKWREFGRLLDIEESQLGGIATQYQNKINECCQAVLTKWMENPPRDYPSTWGKLIELLEDARLPEVSAELKDVLSKADLSGACLWVTLQPSLGLLFLSPFDCLYKIAVCTGSRVAKFYLVYIYKSYYYFVSPVSYAVIAWANIIVVPGLGLSTKLMLIRTALSRHIKSISYQISMKAKHMGRSPSSLVHRPLGPPKGLGTTLALFTILRACVALKLTHTHGHSAPKYFSRCRIIRVKLLWMAACAASSEFQHSSPSQEQLDEMELMQAMSNADEFSWTQDPETGYCHACWRTSSYKIYVQPSYFYTGRISGTMNITPQLDDPIMLRIKKEVRCKASGEGMYDFYQKACSLRDGPGRRGWGRSLVASPDAFLNTRWCIFNLVVCANIKLYCLLMQMYCNSAKGMHGYLHVQCTCTCRCLVFRPIRLVHVG